MSTSKEKLTWAVFSLALILLFGNLGSYGLLEDNEARFFEISWEMTESGDWLTPHLNFINHFHKPPLTFWIVASSLKVFGSSEFAGRLPVAIASLFLLGLTALWSKNQIHGLWASLILVTSVEYWFLSRLVLTDMFLALSVGSALFGFWNLRRSSSRLWSTLLWLSLGLSFLVKGPVGLALVALTLILYRLFGGQAPWKLLLRPEGPILGALVACPWFSIEISRYEGLFSYLIHFQTIDRVATEVHGRGGPFWFYVPVILGGFFPWSPALWVAFRDALRRREDKDLFLLAWILGPLLLFSLSGSKLPTYLLPIFPAFAMLLARSFDQPRSVRAVAISCSLGLVVFALSLMVFLTLGLPPEIAPNLITLLWVTGAACFGATLSIVLCRTQRAEAAVALVGGCFALVLLLLGSGIGKSDAAYSARQLAASIAGQDPNIVVAEYRDHLHGLPYYLRQRIVQISYPRETQFEQNRDFQRFLFKTPEEFLTSLGPSQKALVIMRDSDYEGAALFHGYPHDKIGRWELEKIEVRQHRV